MHRPNFLIIFTIAGLCLSGCTSPTPVEADETLTNAEQDVTELETRTSLDTTLLMNTIDNKRLEIENQLDQIDRIVVDTDSLRAKIKQKWSRIHFYLIDGKVVRIKTYPYPEISERTEEFYFNEGDLILVTIEDNGLGKPGKEKGQIDKMFYFHQGFFLTEYSASKERNHGVVKFEGEELMQEAQEYLSILKAYQ